MLSKNICITWLKAASLITVATGLVSVLASSPSTQGLWLFLLDLLTWPVDGQPSGFQNEAFILNAVLGGVMIGWGTLMFLLSKELHTSVHLVKPMKIALLFWFVSDSAGSLAAGVPGNVVLNITFITMFMIPIYFLQRDIKQ